MRIALPSSLSRMLATPEFNNNKMRQFIILQGVCICVLALCASLRAERLRVERTAEQLVVRQGDRPVVTYNIQSPPAPEGIDPIYERSGFLHPVQSPGGASVTQAFPFDHPHQHGIFSAWVKTTYAGTPVDFWNLAKGTGRVQHDKVVSVFEQEDAAGFEVDLLHRVESSPPVDVLRERWKVTVLRGEPGVTSFDLTLKQTALTDQPLVVEEYHYGGVALRGPSLWLTGNDGDARSRPDSPREPSQFLNSEGSSRQKGNHESVRWVALYGEIEGEPVSVAVLSHKDNYRAPQKARLHPTKPYFCFAPCVDGKFVIDRDHPYEARYRYLVVDKAPDAEWIEAQWRDWHALR